MGARNAVKPNRRVVVGGGRGRGGSDDDCTNADVVTTNLGDVRSAIDFDAEQVGKAKAHNPVGMQHVDNGSVLLSGL